jgi:hypothetical protein
MDEEFFFPQNVQTSYRLFGMGPRHLRRLVMGLPVVLAVAVLVGRFDVLWGVLVGALLAAAYVAGGCWPTDGAETVFDLWLHIRRMQREQTVFLKKVVVDSGAVRSDHRGVRWDLPETADSAGLVDEPAPEGGA